MAFTNFYIDQQTGASDLNAGSTSTNASGSSAAAFTYAGGTFVRATGVFTATGHNPQTDGVTVGTYASVYTTSGAVAATFVAQITARDTTTVTVDVTTLKWGLATSVSETAAATTLKVSGAWASEVVLAATGLGTFTVPVSTKINMTGNLTIVASRTVSINGATTAPIWFSCYNTTPGDLDNDTTNSLAKPVWTFNSTFRLTTSGPHQIWSSLSVAGSVNQNLWLVSGASLRVVRCRSNNSSTSANAVAFNSTSATTVFAYCWGNGATSGSTLGVYNCGATTTLIGCVAVGGASGAAGFMVGVQTVTLIDCISASSAGAGVLATTGVVTAINLTVYAAGTDAIKWSGTPPSSSVVGLLVAGLNGGTATTNGINNASGTNTNNIFRACNDYYNVTNPEVGMGDSFAFFPQTDSAFPLTSATNFTPIATSNALNHGFPGIFENQTFTSYVSIGAVDPPRFGPGLFIQ